MRRDLSVKLYKNIKNTCIFPEYLVKYTYGCQKARNRALAKCPNQTLIGGKLMNVYTTDKIRNVCLLGHGGSGKTRGIVHIHIGHINETW